MKVRLLNSATSRMKIRSRAPWDPIIDYSRAVRGDFAGARNREAIFIRKAKREDMPFIRNGAEEWALDDERISPAQFIVATDVERKLVGFGRIKKYSGCCELGTVGVVPERRGEGIGEAIIRALIGRFPTREVWITTDLREYFERFGFRAQTTGPEELREKIACSCRVKGRLNCRIMLLRK